MLLYVSSAKLKPVQTCGDFSGRVSILKLLVDFHSEKMNKALN